MVIGGRPFHYWINLFLLTHQIHGGQWRRREWPDNGPLLQQYWLMALVFSLIGDELARAALEEADHSGHLPSFR